ncbi:MAG: TIGR04211 family SH3 domain-containing protein [Gammaproteobacteria bacterium]|nr:TIGR04211 family SH3 domain-containing protein [Gammaproteobacteria bacterium]MDH4315090.1 TIGR04211 family SH3 domain-containing protein [Gammaproteobacteria bacterium]MDH5499944.1 TIGR04211 family SH3 domain-containing protein [Gammaproteobacteria bacterium]
MRIAFLLGLLLPASLLAETAYVTDNLRLGLHRAIDTSDRAFRTLESGQQLEIISRDRNYAQVELPDGTPGYVKVAYLVFDKPAKLIVSETQAELESVRKELSDLKAAFAAPAATIESLQDRLRQKQDELDASDANLQKAVSENDSYRRRYEQARFSLPVSWVAIAMGVCLLAGFLASLWWTDHRSRKRHGGVRIY